MTEPQKNQTETGTRARLGPAGWLTVVVLAGFLIGALLYAVHTWNALSGVAMSPMGWVFMILGIVFTCAVGGGLMGLVFYSSRHGKDF